jgi:hypothetical protein
MHNYVFQVSSRFKFFWQKPCMHFLSPRMSRSPWFGGPNIIVWGAQIMKMLIIHFFHVHVFIFAQHFVLRSSQSIFFVRSKKPIFTHSQDNKIIVLYVFISTGLGRWKEGTRFWTELLKGFRDFQLTLVLICYCCLQIHKLCRTA